MVTALWDGWINELMDMNLQVQIHSSYIACKIWIYGMANATPNSCYYIFLWRHRDNIWGKQMMRREFTTTPYFSNMKW